VNSSPGRCVRDCATQMLFPLSEAKFACRTVMVSDWWLMIGSHWMVLACRDLLRLLRLLRNYGSRMARPRYEIGHQSSGSMFQFITLISNSVFPRCFLLSYFKLPYSSPPHVLLCSHSVSRESAFNSSCNYSELCSSLTTQLPPCRRDRPLHTTMTMTMSPSRTPIRATPVARQAKSTCLRFISPNAISSFSIASFNSSNRKKS